jgi:hypothetical protein
MKYLLVLHGVNEGELEKDISYYTSSLLYFFFLLFVRITGNFQKVLRINLTPSFYLSFSFLCLLLLFFEEVCRRGWSGD